MIKELADNIFQILVPLPNSPLKTLNAYLIRGKQNLLFDTGFRMEACHTALLDGLGFLGVSMENTDIFLTHLYSDHAGLVSDIALEQTKVYMSKPDINRMAILYDQQYWGNSDSYFISHGFPVDLLEIIATENPSRKYVQARFNGYIEVRDGDCLKYGDYDLVAIATPGHLPGHMCRYDPISRILFSGDHVLKVILIIEIELSLSRLTG